MPLYHGALGLEFFDLPFFDLEVGFFLLICHFIPTLNHKLHHWHIRVDLTKLLGVRVIKHQVGALDSWTLRLLCAERLWQ